jgi:hypothetical protein
MTFLALILSLSLSSPALAEKIDLTPSGQKNLKKGADGSATHLIFESPKKQPTGAQFKEGTKVTVTATCTDSLGMIHKKGDAGYSGCLRSLDKTLPDAQNDRRRSSVGFTIGE